MCKKNYETISGGRGASSCMPTWTADPVATVHGADLTLTDIYIVQYVLCLDLTGRTTFTLQQEEIHNYLLLFFFFVNTSKVWGNNTQHWNGTVIPNRQDKQASTLEWVTLSVSAAIFTL